MKISVLSLFLAPLVSSASAFFTIIGGSHHQRVNGISPRRHPTTTTRSKCPPTPTEIRGGWQAPLATSVTQLNAAIAPHVWASLLPPFLGLIKSEYTVSVGYGLSIGLTALTLLKNQFAAVSANPLLTLHASSMIFYGFRLSFFLLLRSALSSRIQEISAKNEKKAVERGNRVATRAPLILSCGLLYYGMAIPLWFTGKLVESSSSLPSWAMILLKTLVGVQWLGYAVGALGDSTKTYVKLSEKNERHLVTSGIFSKIRHPNYSGEILAWTANSVIGLIAAALWVPTGRLSATIIANLVLLALGWVGILFVLLQATSGLEERHKKEYSNQPKYQAWIESSWGGWQLPAKQEKKEDHVTPQIEPVEILEEDKGSGI